MKRTSMLAVSLALFGLAALAPTAASAEGFLDLYFGAGFPENDTLEFSVDTAGVNLGTRRRADFDTSATFGLRGGYWFEREVNFIGVGLDLLGIKTRIQDTQASEVGRFSIGV